MNRPINKIEYNSLLLGALLHDIGKLFIQPTGRSKDHPAAGADVIAGHNDALKKAGFDYDLVDCIIRNHHRKQLKDIVNPYHKGIVQIVNHADGCSAGERYQEGKNGPDLRYRPLASVFAHIDPGLGAYCAQGDAEWNHRDYCHYPKILGWKSIFPDKYEHIQGEKLKQKIQNAYKALQENFRKELKELFEDALSCSPDTEKQQQCVLVSLYSIFYKHFWTVPDDVGKVRLDISLFDHTRITAALTAALYLYHLDCGLIKELGQNGVQRDKATILLIKGDLSGIQDYIFNIANIGVGGVAKRLRARSFFLTNLVKVVSHRILHEAVPGAQLPIFCKIIASGGNFIIVAPNLQEVEEQLARIERSVNEWLFHEFQGDLSFSMAWLPVKTADMELPKEGEPDTTRITEKLLDLNELLEERKQQKLSSWLQCRNNDSLSWDETAFVWKGKDKGFPNGLCRSCGKNPATADPESVTNAEDAFCKRCNDDRRFSEAFVKPPKYISFTKTEPACLSQKDKTFKVYSFFEESVPYYAVLAQKSEQIPSDSYLVMCMHPDDLVFQHPSFLQPQANYVSRFENEQNLNEFCDTFCEKTKSECDYYKCVTGKMEDCPDGIRAKFPAVKPFDCLARSVGDNSEKLLGVLKADVDWLGMLFSQGLGRQASLSRIATLSRMVDLFFSGWLTQFLRDEKEFQDTYTVYAGGDDLLIVSSWEKADKLAAAIAENFCEYVARNPEITISAGIAVTKPKFPIAKSVKIADQHLDKAKEIETVRGSVTYPSLLAGKNALCLFGVTTRWFKRNPNDVEEEKLREWAEIFQDGINRKILSKSVTYKLLCLSEMARRWMNSREKHIEDLRYIALASYVIARDIKGNNPSKEEKELAEKLSELLGGEENKRIFAQFRQPITRALLATRRK